MKTLTYLIPEERSSTIQRAELAYVFYPPNYRQVEQFASGSDCDGAAKDKNSSYLMINDYIECRIEPVGCLTIL